MSYSLYQKYRPQTFDDIFSQKHVVKTLTGAIKNNLIGHAYLLTGPRGTGKTSLARIFAKAINCEKPNGKNPCLSCKTCQNIASGQTLDIIEIDAASNTGVDNIRELRETVKLPPTLGKYKVYIIDEVHMLSGGAFNALLKTLEEPPSHVVFILATTEIHKIPETILSRCQRFDLTRLPFDQIIKKLSSIVEKEKMNIEDSAIEMIAIAAEGGMRNAESLLNQIVSIGGNKIEVKQVENILGIANKKIVASVAQNILLKNAAEALHQIHQLSNNGYDLEAFTKSLLTYFRQLLLLAVNEDLSKNFAYELTNDQLESMKQLAKSQPIGQIAQAVTNLLEIQNEIKSSFIPQLPLELAIIKSISKFSQNPPTSSPAVPQQTPKPTSNQPIPAPKTIKPPTPDAEPLQTTKNITESTPDKSSSSVSLHKIKENWRNITDELKQNNFSLAGVISSSQPIKIDGNHLTIATAHSFSKDRVNDSNNQLTIQQCFAKIMEVDIKIKAVTNEEAGIKAPPKPAAPAAQSKKEEINDPIVKEALNIFGGKLVNE